MTKLKEYLKRYLAAYLIFAVGFTVIAYSVVFVDSDLQRIALPWKYLIPPIIGLFWPVWLGALLLAIGFLFEMIYQASLD